MLDNTPLLNSYDDEFLLASAHLLEKLPDLKKKLDFELRLLTNKEHPMAKKAQQLGYSADKLMELSNSDCHCLPFDLQLWGQRYWQMARLTGQVFFLEKMQKELKLMEDRQMANNKGTMLRASVVTGTKSMKGLAGWKRLWAC